MRIGILNTIRFLVAVFALSQVFAIAQLSDRDQNLAACKDGWSLCDRSTLTAAELAAVSTARHAQNLGDCRNGLPPCDHAQLNSSEANSLAVADYQRNLT